MQIDQDIDKLLNSVEIGHHSVESAVQMFIDSLPGFNNNRHRPLTVKKYERCLLLDPKYSFTKHLADLGITFIEDTTIETLERYKDMLLNNLEPQTVRSYITAVRNLYEFVARMGWISESFEKFRLPAIPRRKEIRILPEEVQKIVLNEDWGLNTFTVSRNKVIVMLFLKHGLHPLEFPRIKESHIHPYKDLVYLTVFGKKSVKREVMLDEETVEALKKYMIERAHHMYKNRIKTDNIFLTLTGKDSKYEITTAGVQAILLRIKQILKSQGCLWDLSTLNAQGCRRTAASKKYELAEHLPIHHPELTICGELGHSLEVSQKHYWKHSLKNKYLMAKGSSIIEDKMDRNKLPEKGDDDFRSLYGPSFFTESDLTDQD